MLKKIEFIDVSEKIHEIIYKVTVQINDPRKIEPKILKDFIGKQNTQKVTLIKGTQACEGNLLTLYPHSLVVKLLERKFTAERNDAVLVQFQHPTYDQRFIIHAIVKSVDSVWVTMECQDPRCYRRYNFKLQQELECFQFPESFYAALKKRDAHVIREILHQPTSEGKYFYRYSEHIYSGWNKEGNHLEEDSVGPHRFYPEYTRIVATTPFKGELRDISQGGLCILLNEKLYNKRNLLLVRLTTPPLETIHPALSGLTLSCNLLASMRGVSTIGRKYGLHLQFLKRLEDNLVEDTLSALEKSYKLNGTPL